MDFVDYKNQEIKTLGDEITRLNGEIECLREVIKSREEVIARKEHFEITLFNESYHLDKCLHNALAWVWEHTGEDDEYYLDVCRNYIGLNDNEMKKEQEALDSR